MHKKLFLLTMLFLSSIQQSSPSIAPPNTLEIKDTNKRIFQHADIMPLLLDFFVDDNEIQQHIKAMYDAVNELNVIKLHQNASVLHFYASKISRYSQLEYPINSLSFENGNSLLHCIAYRSKCFKNPVYQKKYSFKMNRMIHELLKSIDANIKNESENTALHIAASRNNIDMIKILFKANANMNARNKKGYTPIDRCLNIINNSTIETIETLVFLGAKINTKDNNFMSNIENALSSHQAKHQEFAEQKFDNTKIKEKIKLLHEIRDICIDLGART